MTSKPAQQMHRAIRAACCVAVIAAALLAQAAAAPEQQTSSSAPLPDTVRDYSHALPLSVSGKQGVVRFRLPQTVYLHAHAADLSDVRLFDATGARLAFALHQPPSQERIQRRSLPVKIFPLASNQPPSSTGIDLDIRTAADGSLLSVRAKGGKATPAHGQSGTPALTGLVLDLGQTDSSSRPRIEALRFSLPPKITSYSAQIWLEVSDDLKQWETIGAAELNWLVNGDTQTLANDRLEFEARSFRYARLGWRNGEPLQFAAIMAESIDRTEDLPALDSLLLQPAAGKEAQDLVYQASVAIPVEKIGLQFTEPNVVLPAALGSYHEVPGRQIGQPATWQFQPVTRATFYQITQDGQARRPGDIALPVTHLAEWVVRPQTASTAKPALRLRWQPATLIFFASGTGPYTLAFGRDKVKSGALDLAQVAPGFSVQELQKLEQATPGALQVRQGTQTPNNSDARLQGQTRIWILWGVLLLGVSVLAVLTWRLFKQMK